MGTIYIFTASHHHHHPWYLPSINPYPAKPNQCTFHGVSSGATPFARRTINDIFTSLDLLQFCQPIQVNYLPSAKLSIEFIPQINWHHFIKLNNARSMVNKDIDKRQESTLKIFFFFFFNEITSTRFINHNVHRIQHRDKRSYIIVFIVLFLKNHIMAIL